MKECGFKFETQKSPKYEYGRGKDYETREEALETAKKVKQDKATQISLIGFWKMLDSIDIIEEQDGFVVEIKYKVPIFNF